MTNSTNSPNLLGRFFLALPAVCHDCIPDLIRNTCPRAARAKNNDFHVGEFDLTYVQASQNCCKRYTSSALDIIIKDSMIRSILIKNAPCISQCEILKVNIRPWKQFPGRLDEFLDECIILLASHSWLLQAQVEVIIEQLLVIRPGIQHNGKRAIGMNARASSCEDQLCNRDENSADALVTNAQDFFAVRNNNVVDVIGASKLGHPGLHFVAVIDVEEAAFRPAEQAAVILDRLALGGRVDDAEHFQEVVLQ